MGWDRVHGMTLEEAEATVVVDGEIRTVGRPDFIDHDWGRTVAKRMPTYVYATRQGLLLHKVSEMTFYWWKLGPNGKYWIRRTSPRITYHSICGQFFFGHDPEPEYKRQEGRRSVVCEMPNPDAVLCGRCHGRTPTFAKGNQPKAGGPTRHEARARLGCMMSGEIVYAGSVKKPVSFGANEESGMALPGVLAQAKTLR
jgi:hypothetical protein